MSTIRSDKRTGLTLTITEPSGQPRECKACHSEAAITMITEPSVRQPRECKAWVPQWSCHNNESRTKPPTAGVCAKRVCHSGADLTMISETSTVIRTKPQTAGCTKTACVAVELTSQWKLNLMPMRWREVRSASLPPPGVALLVGPTTPLSRCSLACRCACRKTLCKTLT